MRVHLIDFSERKGIITVEDKMKMNAQKASMGSCTVLVRKNGEETFSVFDKGEMLEIMKYLSRTYEKNNEISSQIIDKIPGMHLLIIDDDVNSQKDNPIIVYYRLVGDNEEVGTITVRKHHKIIWSILNEFYPKTL